MKHRRIPLDKKPEMDHFVKSILPIWTRRSIEQELDSIGPTLERSQKTSFRIRQALVDRINSAALELNAKSKFKCVFTYDIITELMAEAEILRLEGDFETAREFEILASKLHAICPHKPSRPHAEKLRTLLGKKRSWNEDMIIH